MTAEVEGRRRWLAKVPPHQRASIIDKMMILELARENDDVVFAQFQATKRRDPAAALRMLRDTATFNAIYMATTRSDAKAAKRVLEAWDKAASNA